MVADNYPPFPLTWLFPDCIIHHHWPLYRVTTEMKVLYWLLQRAARYDMTCLRSRVIFSLIDYLLHILKPLQLTMWDLRVKENGGCLKRICGSPGDILYATSFSPTGNIAVGGADRTVTIYDPRRLVIHWFCCESFVIVFLIMLDFYQILYSSVLWLFMIVIGRYSCRLWWDKEMDLEF